ncbi:MAG: dihydrolipoyl dehydrogenase [Alphaproteobacteria bacterium]
MEEFDVVVIGAGPGGYVAAIRATQLGMKTAIIEREHLGGICLNWGCIPTKALLKSSEVNHLLHNLDEYGFSVKEISFNFDKIIERSRKVASQLSGGIKHLLKKNKVTVFDGDGKISGKNKISIKSKNSNTEIKAKHIIIATGARARNLPNLEADGKLIWSYKEAMTPPKFPKNLLVIGSGAIGVEFASFYHNMGSKVTIVEIADRILANEDDEISNFAHKTFTKQGIIIHTATTVKSLKKNADNVVVTLDTKGKTTEVTFDRIITAVGITANTENLGLENTKVKLDRGHIVTDNYLKTAEEGIYAIGDVTGAPWLAHKASHEAIICIEKIAGLNPHPIKLENIPGCTYCRPQIASVGLTEKKAIEAGYKVKVGRFPFIGNGKAIALGEPEGLVKTVYDEKTGELLGAHMIGTEVTEMIQGFVITKSLEGTELDLMHTIFPHPTLSEMMHESTLDAYAKAIHI